VEAKNEAQLTNLAPEYLVKETLTPEFLDYAVHQAIAKTKVKQQLAAAKRNTPLKQPFNGIFQTIHSSLSNQFQRESSNRRQSEINLQTFLDNTPAIIYTGAASIKYHQEGMGNPY
jgi:hypothetical protein